MPEDRDLTILKAVLPYLKPPLKDTVKTCIRFFEIRKTMERLDQEEEELAACSPNAEEASLYDIFQSVRDYCTPKEADTLDMLINLTQMVKYYKDFETGGEPAHDFP